MRQPHAHRLYSHPFRQAHRKLPDAFDWGVLTVAVVMLLGALSRFAWI